MKSKILLILCILFFSVSFLTAISIKGVIVSNELDEVPRFKIYYNGIRVNNDEEGFFTIPVDEQKQDLYHILICKDFEPRFDSVNTVKEMSVPANKPNRFFKVKRADANSIKKKLDLCQKDLKTTEIKFQLVDKQTERQAEFIEFFESKKKPEKYRDRIQSCHEKIKTLKASKKSHAKSISILKNEVSSLRDQYQKIQKLSGNGGDIWLIKEEQIKSKNFAIPQNCLVVNMNPKIVENVDNWKFLIGKDFICLPRIILKNNLETKNIKRKQSVVRSAVKSEFYSLDKNAFHEIKREKICTFPDKPALKTRLTV